MNEKVTVNSSQAKCEWNQIDWKRCAQFVRKLCQAIFRAAKETAKPQASSLLLPRGNPRESIADKVNCLSRMRGKGAPWYALIELPVQLVSVRDKDTEVNNLPNPERERGK